MKYDWKEREIYLNWWTKRDLDGIIPCDYIYSLVMKAHVAFKNENFLFSVNIDLLFTYLTHYFQLKWENKYHVNKFVKGPNRPIRKTLGWTTEDEKHMVDHFRYLFDSSWWEDFLGQEHDWEHEIWNWRNEFPEILLHYLDRIKQVGAESDSDDESPYQKNKDTDPYILDHEWH